MTLDIRTMQDRLDLILDYLGELRPLTELSLEEFLSDRYKIRAAERLLEITVQAALDINNHLLKEHFQVPKKSNSDGFIELGQFGAISPELAQDLTRSGNFRNRLAHRYHEIDFEILFQIIPEALAQYPDYVEQMTDFMDSLEDRNE